MSNPIMGWVAKLSRGGTATTMTTEACTLVSGTTYQISNVAKRVLDPATAIVVNNGGSPVSSADIVSIDALFGTVTLASGTWGTITISGKYIPRSAVAYVKSVKGSIKSEIQDVTVMNSSGYRMRMPGMRDWSGSFDLFDHPSDQNIQTAITGRTPLLVDFDQDGTGGNVLRGWVVLTQMDTTVEPSTPNGMTYDFSLDDQSRIASAATGAAVTAGFSIGAA